MIPLLHQRRFESRGLLAVAGIIILVGERRASTQIPKASTRTFPFLPANEFICLKVSEMADLRTPNITLSADGELLLVERFDILGEGKHLGFEEVAVLMGESSATKYQR